MEGRYKYILIYLKKVRFNISNFLFFIYLVFLSCEAIDSGKIKFTGKTMGTTYSIIISGLKSNIKFKDQIAHKVDSTLKSINMQMSTYIEESEISKFNESATMSIYPSLEFLDVLEYGRELSKSTDGMFDITVAPLVELWGFTDQKLSWVPPDKLDINRSLGNIGNRTWNIVSGELVKLNPDMKIDVNAIAKGFGVDIISNLLKSLGYNNYMVEIGGEVYCSGKNDKDELWKIGVELPSFDTRILSRVVGLSDAAMATSGDYRNYYTYDGKNYSHTINPESGTPIEHSLASVTVISKTCMDADGLATALLVMGTNKAIDYIEKNDLAECLLIERDENGDFRSFMSSGFGAYLIE